MDNAVPQEPALENAALTELAQRLTGRWRITGPNIDGQAEYDIVRAGSLVVGTVQVAIEHAHMTNIQHISHHEPTGTLRARYMDSFGNEATYIWELDGEKIRVTEGDSGSGTYFEASFNDDNTEYIGAWHYPGDPGDPAADEQITYTRIS